MFDVTVRQALQDICNISLDDTMGLKPPYPHPREVWVSDKQSSYFPLYILGIYISNFYVHIIIHVHLPKSVTSCLCTAFYQAFSHCT